MHPTRLCAFRHSHADVSVCESSVWLDDLSPERDPHSYDLCVQHANRLTAPSGWHLEDRRQRVHVYSPGRLAG